VVERRPGGRGYGRAGLIAVGIAGGLVPSPSALVVLLGAAAVGRAWFGVVLVVAFGVGMALTLSATGLLLVLAQDKLKRVSHPRWAGAGRVYAMLPLGSAVAVCALGIFLTVRGLAGLA
jgi:ABC-type nickel/cobalt efflux system permease component RcnA